MAGFRAWLPIFLLTALIGGFIALVFVLRRRATGYTLKNVVFILRELSHGRDPARMRPELSVDSPQALTVPHGVSIALGVLSYLVLSRNLHQY